MMCLKFYFYVLLFCIFLMFTAPTAPNFGKFKVRIDNFELCKGPKRKDCTKWDTQIQDEKIMVFNVTITQNVAPLKIKVVVSSNGKVLVRLQMARICDNLFMKPLFTAMFNATNQCFITKGNYHYVLDMQEIYQQYYGGQFLYGTVQFKTVINNDQCNFSCSTMTVTFVPNKSK